MPAKMSIFKKEDEFMRNKINKMFLVFLCLIITGFLSFGAAKKQFKIWYFERDNAMAASWSNAMDEFKKKHPDVDVLFELKAFEEVQQNARMILNSDEAPDIMQTNKGNATAGQYVKDGLLTNLEQVAKQRGWNKLMSPSIQTTCRYSDKGMMGSGDLWGITTYGEYVMVYYNKTMFVKFGMKVPANLVEFEKVCDTFKSKGIVPFALGASSSWPTTHNWFEMVLYKADRKLVNDYQILGKDVDLKSESFRFGTQKLADYIKKGYFDPKANGILYEDANLSFIQQTHPMMLTGSWLYKWVVDNVKDTFDWDIFLMPGKKLNTGSGGNLFVVPKNAKNKDYAYEYIDLVLGKTAQTVMANNGGIPVNADISAIKDPKIKRLNETFAAIVKNDGLSFYPDWPVPDFMTILSGDLQELIAGTKNVDAFLDDINKSYTDYRKKVQ
jgi:raffinose/stachyose/melibiose transport system substrate-binding protein